MYQYKIMNKERLTEEIDNLLSFPLLKEQIKQKLFETIVSDAKENCEYLTPEKLFEEKEYGVWFHTINYSEFKKNIARYDTFILYRCVLADNRQEILITLE
ncbi:hypothetical protein HQ708_06900 [Enterococcus faecium]|nr:hypothetical protein [Enterococcus faecium]